MIQKILFFIYHTLMIHSNTQWYTVIHSNTLMKYSELLTINGKYLVIHNKN